MQIEAEGEAVTAHGVPHDWRLATSNSADHPPVNMADTSRRQMTPADGDFGLYRPPTQNLKNRNDKSHNTTQQPKENHE